MFRQVGYNVNSSLTFGEGVVLVQSICDFIKESERYEDELVGVEMEDKGDES